MLLNYLKLVFRIIQRNKIYSTINILGLAIGMAVAILIFLWVQDELSYDSYHANVKNIYQVYKSVFTKDKDFWTLSSDVTIVKGLKRDFPEIINTARLGRPGEIVIKVMDKVFIEKRAACVDQSYFTVFTFPFIKGEKQTALSNPNSIVLTEDISRKYFGNVNPVGKTLRVNNSVDCVVTGIIENIPANTNMKFDIFLPLVFLAHQGINIEHYGYGDIYSYIVIQDNADFESLNRKIYDGFSGHVQENNIVEKYYLIPFTQVRFYRNAHQIVVDVFSLLAIVILLIACINFINISTARSMKRAKEVGIRKVFGANQSQLRYQFLSESLFISFAALLTALFLAEISLPFFNYFSEKRLTIDYLNYRHVLTFTAVFLATGIISGVYPAFFLSSFKPITVLKKTSIRAKRGTLRRTLVVIQFALSIVLIISTIYLYRQIEFMRYSDLGFDRSNIIVTNLKGDIRQKLKYVKNELMRIPGIVSLTSSNNLPQSNGNFISISNTDKPDNASNAVWDVVDYDYIKTFGMKLTMGRFFTPEYIADNETLVINESAVKTLGLTNPLDQSLLILNRNYRIIGVIRDFHNRPLVYPIEPMVLTLNPEANIFLFIRVKPGTENTITGTMKSVKNICSNFSPDYPLEYNYLEDISLEGTDDMKGIAKVLLLFTILGITISCLGLYGLTSFIAEQCTKEVGIRKVLGGSIFEILRLFLKEYVFVILIGNVIAMPVAYLLVSKTIQSAYRPSFNLWIFIFTGIAVLVLVLFTTSYQAIKAARANPVESLKYE